MAAPAPLAPCIYSTVKNISGKTRAFGFLGRHGKTLAPNAEYTFFGDLVARMSSQSGKNMARWHTALNRALAGFTSAAGVVYPAMLHVKASPALFLFDTGANVPKTFTLVSGTLGVADPCYGSGY